MNPYELLRSAVLRPVRHFFLLGPWNPAVCKLIRRCIHKRPIHTHDSGEISQSLDTDLIVASLKQKGAVSALRVNADITNQLRQLATLDPKRLRRDPHKRSRLVQKIVQHRSVVDIARGYLGTEPTLHSSAIVRTKAGQYDNASRFHFDSSDWKGLTLFVHLTDVDEDCHPHSVILGTHGRKTIAQILKRYLPDNEAHREYGGHRIKTFVGPSGTAVCEDLTIYHKRSHGSRERLVLMANYVLCRNARAG